ncbi:outer membrane lipid asymmetry maintenance protein MlaD [Methylomonas sp. BW4-1]|uniref:Outer membrane lipid asymmetry maintenance protein MlaD n=1 Tax=Methylomonas defluvii TaxID=3045149 RepID=A0ABU4UJF2_9GAMM|nr:MULTISPECIES: outer membrane lipid asymmetry maintenance protein MlaD [unclassified Methylomonas]MDX8129012.1 outer membrane lipid asymmetry maintenance protein MlaD [Methylomonas sp. OY6]NOV32343.1 outer membrane lipid asymmetry maintenance protein MlaD [Methylomonas sp. ZR1]PKD39047.1 outer membrane lipid asymmetry maintenance protein MlaD [Methylomonas sp. Kb3]QBC29297.1 outer membrane lipid asymmetry maintenance protein MlaD [Methylomonas sp. LW13]QSB00873.1 outer membrane lipid asymmet
MQHSKTQDTLVGFFVASGIAALFYMALQVSNLGSYSSDDSYTVIAHFQNSGGLKVKSPVSVAGVRIGRVSAIRLDKDSHESVVEMRIESQYNNLPSDSGVSIYTAGLLGEQYVSLDPGSSDEYLKDKSTIDITSSAIVLEEMIGKFMLNKAEGK